MHRRSDNLFFLYYLWFGGLVSKHEPLCRDIFLFKLQGFSEARRASIRFRNQAGQVRIRSYAEWFRIRPGRCLAALMENYQTQDGSVQLPDNLPLLLDEERLIRILYSSADGWPSGLRHGTWNAEDDESRGFNPSSSAINNVILH